MHRTRVVKGVVAAAAVLIVGCTRAGGRDGSVAFREPPRVMPGINVLLSDSLSLIRGKRIALLTNQTGVDALGVSDIELLRDAMPRQAGVQLVKLFSPEHGIRGTEDREGLESGIDARSGLPVHSSPIRRARLRRRTVCSRMSTRSCSICKTSALGRGRTWERWSMRCALQRAVICR